MPHPFPSNLCKSNLNTALFANYSAVFHSLVLTAVTLVILDRSEDLGAEETIPLGLKRAVIDRLRILDLAVAPRLDVVRRRHRDARTGGGIRGRHGGSSRCRWSGRGLPRCIEDGVPAPGRALG